MKQRELLKGGVCVSSLGLGCMGMGEFNDPDRTGDMISIQDFRQFLESGGNFLDTADIYGSGRIEVLVVKTIAGRYDEVILATKFANFHSLSAVSRRRGSRGDSRNLMPSKCRPADDFFRAR